MFILPYVYIRLCYIQYVSSVNNVWTTPPSTPPMESISELQLVTCYVFEYISIQVKQKKNSRLKSKNLFPAFVTYWWPLVQPGRPNGHLTKLRKYMPHFYVENSK